jgi:polyferredoxin
MVRYFLSRVGAKTDRALGGISRIRMARQTALDRTKEELAYLRFWQGIVVVTDVSLLGWSISAFGNAPPLLTTGLGVSGVLLLTAVAVVLHKQIARSIERLGVRGWKRS